MGGARTSRLSHMANSGVIESCSSDMMTTLNTDTTTRNDMPDSKMGKAGGTRETGV